jgi:O-antigen/teichoic acid export membrane protein
VFFNLSIWYKLNNLTKFGAMITMTGAIITFLVNWMFIPVYGYTASAWAHVACYGSMVVLSWSLGRKHYRINYPYWRIGMYFAMGMLIFWASRYTDRLDIIAELAVNTFLLAGFTIIVVFNERKEFSKLNTEESS